MKQTAKFRRTTIISVGLAAFLFGLVFAKWQSVRLSVEWLLLALPLIFTFRRKNVLALVAVSIIGLILGVWRGGNMLQAVGDYQTFIGQNTTLTGNIRNDPVYDERGQFDFRVTGVVAQGQQLPGEVRVRGYINDIRRGDTVQVSGLMQPGFASYQASVSFAEITVLERSGSWLEAARREFFAGTYSVLPEPQASLGLGYLVGLRSALPDDFDEQLRIAGLTHIVVASGYNLTILVRLARRLLAKRSKYQAFIVSVVLVLSFIAVTGASPSINRAALVTLLSLLAWYYGRRIHPVLIIFLGAAITAGISPIYIWHDLGWWLSFLAFGGVLLLAPLLSKRLYPGRQPPIMVQVAIETMAAQAMATPLIMFVFGEFSLTALVANVAVVPLIPFAMIATFIGGLGGIFSPVIGAWLAIPANLILSYMVAATQFFSQFSWAKQEIAMGAAGMVLLYGLVFLVGAALRRRTHMKFHEVPAAVE